MACALLPPAKTRRWTRVEYERLVELGVFQPGERLELLDGQLVVREPQGSRARGDDPAGARRDPGAYISAHPSRAVLIVEIAESSYRIDREHKAGPYARAGVPDYWIVDVVGNALDVHRSPEVSPEAPYGWRYRNVATLRPPAAVTPLVVPGFVIPLATLLP
jgi:Uma2 family endonuclease